MAYKEENILSEYKEWKRTKVNSAPAQSETQNLLSEYGAWAEANGKHRSIDRQAAPQGAPVVAPKRPIYNRPPVNAPAKPVVENPSLLGLHLNDMGQAAGAFLRAGMRDKAIEANRAYFEQDALNRQAKQQEAINKAAGYQGTDNFAKKGIRSVGAGAMSALQGLEQSMNQIVPEIRRPYRERAAEAYRMMQNREEVPADLFKDEYKPRITDTDTVSEIKFQKDMEKAGGAGKFALQMGNVIGGMIPSIVANTFVPGSGAFVMGAQVAGNEYVDALEKYGDRAKAQTVAAGKGIISAEVEQLGRLFGNSKIAESAGKLVKKAPWLDKTLKSPFGKWVADAISEGIEEGVEDVAHYAFEKVLTNEAEPLEVRAVLYDMLMGFSAGGLMSGAAGGINSAQYSRLGKSVKMSEKATADVIAEASENPTAEQAYWLEKVSKGDTSNNVIGRLKALNDGKALETAENAISNGTVTYKQIRAIISNSRAARQIESRLELNPETTTSDELTSAIIEESAAAAAAPKNEALRASVNVLIETPANTAETVCNKAISGAAPSEAEAREIAGSPSLAAEFSARTGARMTGNMAYDTAAVKVAAKKLGGKPVMTEAQLAKAEQANIAAAKEKQAARIQMEQAEHQRRQLEYIEELKGTATKRELRALDDLAKKVGVTIVIDEDIPGSNGFYDPETNTIHISARADNKVGVVAIHEVTHALESLNPEAYEKLKGYAFQMADESRLAELSGFLAQNGYEAEALEGELTAHLMQTLVTDEKSFEDLIRYDRTLAEKVVDAIDKVVRRFKKELDIGRTDANESLRNEIGATAESMEKAADAMRDALGIKQGNKGTATSQGKESKKLGLNEDEEYDKIKKRRAEPERQRALRPGEMVNGAYAKVDWPAYYEEIKKPEFDPDYYDVGDMTFISVGEEILTIQLMENGEFSVVSIGGEQVENNDRFDRRSSGQNGGESGSEEYRHYDGRGEQRGRGTEKRNPEDSRIGEDIKGNHKKMPAANKESLGQGEKTDTDSAGFLMPKNKPSKKFSPEVQQMIDERVAEIMEEQEEQRRAEAIADRNEAIKNKIDRRESKESTGMGEAVILGKKPKPVDAESADKKLSRYRTLLTNSMSEVERFGKAVGDKTIRYMANNVGQSYAAAQTAIGEGLYNLTGTKKLSGSLVDAFSPAEKAGLMDEFSDFLYNRHNIARMRLRAEEKKVFDETAKRLRAKIKGLSHDDIIDAARLTGKYDAEVEQAAKEYLDAEEKFLTTPNKPVFGESRTAEKSEEIVERYLAEHPEFEEWAKPVYQYLDGLMKLRIEAGLVDKKTAMDLAQKYPYYVPTHRDMSKVPGRGTGGGVSAGNGRVSVKSTINEATGSNLPLLPLKEQIADMTSSVEKAARTNPLFRRIYKDAMETSADISEFISDMDTLTEPFDIADEINDGLREPEQPGRLSFYENGKKVTVKVNPEMLAGLMPKKGIAEDIKAAKAMEKAMSTFRKVTTQWSPAFIFRNFFKDLGAALVYTHQGLGTYLKNYARAYHEMLTNGEHWTMYKALGGTASTYYSYEDGFSEAPKTETGKKFEKMFHWLGDINMFVEQSNRMAEFIYQAERGGKSYDNLMEALYKAADITVNFGRTGTLIRYANRYFVPFFNAGIQGTSRLVRNFSEAKDAKEMANRFLRFILCGLTPKVLTALMLAGFGDKEDKEGYEKLRDIDKDANILIPLGGGSFAKIPIGREVSVVTSLANRVERAAKGDKDAFKGYFEFVGNQILPNNPLTNNILSPVLAMTTNKAWHGGDVVPLSLQRKANFEQYDEGTDAFSIWLGQISQKITGGEGLSPKKINYLIDQYSGFIGDFILPAMSKRASVNPMVKAFVVDSVRSNRLAGDFYDLKEHATAMSSSSIGTPSDQLVAKYLNKVSGQANNIKKAINEIYQSDIPNKQKIDDTEDLLRLQNKLYEEALLNVEEFERTAKDSLLETSDAEAAYNAANRKMFGGEYALQLADPDRYERAKALVSDGISYDAYFDAWSAQKGIVSDKDENGKSIPNSASRKKKEAIDKAVHLSPSRMHKLYEEFNISKKVW